MEEAQRLGLRAGASKPGRESRQCCQHRSETLTSLRDPEALATRGFFLLPSPGFHFETNNETDKREFEKAVETIAVSFSST